MDRNEAIVAKWVKNDLRFKLRGWGEPCPPGKVHGQVHLWHWIQEMRGRDPDDLGPFTCLAHRRLGKSSVGVLYCIWRCREKPWTNCVFLAPLQNQVEGIVRPILRRIFRDCPKELAPHKSRNLLTFTNPTWGDSSAVSTLSWIGVDKSLRGTHLRGLESNNVVVLDEARDVKPSHFEFVLEDVLQYSFIGMHDPTFLAITTPPDSAAHPSMQLIKDSILDDKHLEIRASQNADFTERDKRIVLGGRYDENSNHYLREAECHCIPDESSAAVPEWLKVRDNVVIKTPESKADQANLRNLIRPKHFFPLTSTDLGYIDRTAILYAYVDFDRRQLVVEDEIIIRRCLTKDLAKQKNAKDREIFYDEYGRALQPFPIRNFGNAQPKELEELRREKVYIIPAETYDKAGALSKLRSLLVEGRIRIWDRCQSLLFDLENAQLNWNEYRTNWNFRRTEKGHADALAALIYLARMAPWNINPMPSIMYADYDIDTFVHPSYRPPQTPTIQITRDPITVTHHNVGIYRQ